MSSLIPRQRSLLASMLAAGALAVGVIGLAAPAQAAETCEAFGTIEMGKYYLNNNLWGQDSGSGTQCVRDTSQNGDTIGWNTNWSWTGDQNSVKSYVSSVLGWHWHPIDADTGLPVQLSSGATVNSGWDFAASGSGTYNVAYDLWLTNTETPDGNTTPTDEIMIWLHRTGGAGPVGSLVGTVEVAGSTWDLYQGNIGWEVYSFVRTENTGSFQADLMDFADYLVANRGLDASKYLASVESGTEVFHGDGELDTSSYYTNVSGPAQGQEPLRDLADARGKLIGAAVDTNPLANEAQYSQTLAEQFNQVTAENAMKWDATEPSQGQFNWSGADAIMDFAEANNQSVHGHTLVWHSQTPGWVQSLPADQMRAAMENHISEVVGRYQDRIVSWDVVNEAFNDDGSMRNSFWYQTLGESYIADAFRYADAADPNAKLCINDYNVEGINAKSDAMYELVSGLLDQGVPIDCVGIQGHLAIQYGFPGDIQQNIQRFADLGLDVKITELDVRMELPVDDSKLATQATYYGNVLDACLAVERCLGVTTWGFTDKYSWVPDTFEGQGAALPYDENYQPKPAYNAIHDALAN